MGKDKQKPVGGDPRRFLTGHCLGQSQLNRPPDQVIYAQGDAADALFFLEHGLVKVTRVSPGGKEAVVALRKDGEFFGTRCLIKKFRRPVTVTTLTECYLVRITRPALIRLLRDEPDFAETFATWLATQNLRDQETVFDQMTNSAEKRLARVLLQLARISGDDANSLPVRINHAVLANMIGTTRPRVSAFMNKFRRFGFIAYNRRGYVSVRNSLLNMLQEG